MNTRWKRLISFIAGIRIARLETTTKEMPASHKHSTLSRLRHQRKRWTIASRAIGTGMCSKSFRYKNARQLGRPPSDPHGNLLLYVFSLVCTEAFSGHKAGDPMQKQARWPNEIAKQYRVPSEHASLQPIQPNPSADEEVPC